MGPTHILLPTALPTRITMDTAIGRLTRRIHRGTIGNMICAQSDQQGTRPQMAFAMHMSARTRCHGACRHGHGAGPRGPARRRQGLPRNTFSVALEEGLRQARALGTGAGISARHREIRAVLEELCDALRDYLGRGDAASVGPWLSTNDGEGKKVAVRATDGYELTLIRLSVPLGGYPVTVRLGDRDMMAADGAELRAALATVLRDPNVAALVEQVKAM